jgi:hypothetical protein
MTKREDADRAERVAELLRGGPGWLSLLDPSTEEGRHIFDAMLTDDADDAELELAVSKEREEDVEEISDPRRRYKARSRALRLLRNSRRWSKPRLVVSNKSEEED